jgi:hypothetical protein
MVMFIVVLTGIPRLVKRGVLNYMVTNQRSWFLDPKVDKVCSVQCSVGRVAGVANTVAELRSSHHVSFAIV